MTPEAPKSYVIDVCVVCGRHAVYPFSCGHRSSTEIWTAPLVVRPTVAARRAVQAGIDRSAEVGLGVSRVKATADQPI